MRPQVISNEISVCGPRSSLEGHETSFHCCYSNSVCSLISGQINFSPQSTNLNEWPYEYIIKSVSKQNILMGLGFSDAGWPSIKFNRSLIIAQGLFVCFLQCAIIHLNKGY